MTSWSTPSAPGPISGDLHIPGSKSATARAYVLAALADGPSVLTGVLRARDTDLMRAGLAALGVGFEELDDTAVRVIPPTQFTGGRTIDAGLSGTVARFLPPLAATSDATTTFVGDPAMATRPVEPLLRALTGLGATVTGTHVPFAITGPIAGGGVDLDSSGSSQFLSALLLIGARLPEGLVVRETSGHMPSRPHVDMTAAMLRERGVDVGESDGTWRVAPGPIAARDATIEPDLTNTATFLAAALATGGRLSTPWPALSVQPQGAVLDVLRAFGAEVTVSDGVLTVAGPADLPGVDVDLHAVSELTPAVAALATLASTPSRIRGVAHIRAHETDRLAALERELNGLGAVVRQTDDGLLIEPAPLHAGPFATYADHRMAHAGALVGLRVAGITLDDVACTSKTMPDFADRWSSLVGG